MKVTAVAVERARRRLGPLGHRHVVLAAAIGFVLLVGSSAFLDDLLEHRHLGLADLGLAALITVITGTGVFLLYRALVEQVRLREQAEQRAATQSEVLAVALDARDRYTGSHSERVVQLCRAVGERLGLTSPELAELELVARMHDIGKLGVPDAILNKQGPLDRAEWAVMREHPVWGEQLLRRIPGLEGIATLVRAEHERWDGGGYPDGLSGEQIPLASRIVLVCDAFHAMTSNRPYRQAMSLEQAVSELGEHAGSQFDPRVVEALLQVLERELVTASANAGVATPSTILT